MNEPKLTPWFPAHVKPARRGVYERHWGHGDLCFALWTGKRWNTSWSDPWIAAERSTRISGVQHLPWRGLAKEPK